MFSASLLLKNCVPNLPLHGIVRKKVENSFANFFLKISPVAINSTTCPRCFSDQRIDLSKDSTTDSKFPDVRIAEIVENPQGPIVSGSEPQRKTAPVKRRGFAAAFEKFRGLNLKTQENPTKEEKDETFAGILRKSKYIQMGHPEGKIVVGRIFHIIEDDLYVDFGGKFHCVCKRPQQDEQEYYRGAFVRLRLGSLELSTRFLGADKDLTLLEAEAALLGPMKLPGQRTDRNPRTDRDPRTAPAE